MNKKRSILALLCLILLLTACQPPRPETLRTPTGDLPTPTATATAAATKAATSAPQPSPTPTPLTGPGAERLAWLDSAGVHIFDLVSYETIAVQGQYQRLNSWSPGGEYLLAVRADGASVVLSAGGETLAELDQLAQPAFWAAPNNLDSPEDWLALPQANGALDLRSFPLGTVRPVLEPGSLGADGMADIRWGSNGEWIVTPSLSQLLNQVSFEHGLFAPMLGNGPNAQILVEGGSGGGTVSWDFQQDYFQVLDSVPGDPLALLMGLVVQQACLSCQIDGLELASFNPWPGTTLPLGVVMLNTREAYAWNPVQPGLLAIAAGGSRFTIENKRLALLDVPAGQLHYLTGEDQVAFEPAWSPDGWKIAYTVLPAVGPRSGSGVELEAQLGGRGIAMHDLQIESTRMLTQPASDEIDGWPRWSANGQKLFYARKRLADSTTEIRQLELATGEDRSYLSLPVVPEACHNSGCGWDAILAYSPGETNPADPALEAAPNLILSPTLEPHIQIDIPQLGVNTYRNSGYGFSFQYPSSWQIENLAELPNTIRVTRDGYGLTIGFRRATQNVSIQRTGTGAGDFVSAGSIDFLGQTLPRSALVYGGKVKAIFYQSACEFSAGDRFFSLSLDDFNPSYDEVDIPADVQAEVDLILESFQLDTP